MKTILKITIFSLFLITISNVIKAQEVPTIYYAVIQNQNGEKVSGLVSDINSDGINLSTKKAQDFHISYQHIKTLKIFKKHKDLAFSLITGAAAVGAIIAAQQVNDGGQSTLIGIGGTLSVVALSMWLHSIIHKPELKMKTKTEQINYQTVSAKFPQFKGG